MTTPSQAADAPACLGVCGSPCPRVQSAILRHLDTPRCRSLAHTQGWHARHTRRNGESSAITRTSIEIGQADQGPLDELTQLKVLARGDDILRDLERLLKDEALETRQDPTPHYFVNRLLDAVRHLLPIVTAFPARPADKTT